MLGFDYEYAEFDIPQNTTLPATSKEELIQRLFDNQSAHITKPNLLQHLIDGVIHAKPYGDGPFHNYFAFQLANKPGCKDAIMETPEFIRLVDAIHQVGGATEKTIRGLFCLYRDENYPDYLGMNDLGKLVSDAVNQKQQGFGCSIC